MHLLAGNPLLKHENPTTYLRKKKKKGKEKPKLAKYTVKGKEVWRPYREFGYINVNGGGDPDPNYARSKNKKKKAERAAKVQRTKTRATDRGRRKTVGRPSKNPI